MKFFDYRWCEEYFLLHLQLNNPQREGFSARLIREFPGQQQKTEEIPVLGGNTSHRIMISRSHPNEAGIRIEYPDHINIEVFRLDDRAYYPTEAYFRG